MSKILILVGQAGSGKDTAADYICKKYGYKHISTADILRDYIKKNMLGDLTRQNMHKVATKLRDEQGNDVLVRWALEGAGTQKILLSALRHPDEADYAIAKGGKVISTVASAESRYKRSLLRNRIGDKIDFDTFKQLEINENKNAHFDVSAIQDRADYTLHNNAGYKSFYNQIEFVMLSLAEDHNKMLK
jgi:dephospho-CoA kinase